MTDVYQAKPIEDSFTERHIRAIYLINRCDCWTDDYLTSPCLGCQTEYKDNILPSMVGNEELFAEGTVVMSTDDPTDNVYYFRGVSENMLGMLERNTNLSYWSLRSIRKKPSYGKFKNATP